MKRRRLRLDRIFVWGLVLSVLFHFGVVPLIVALLARSQALRAQQSPIVSYKMESSALRLEPRPHPLPRSLPHHAKPVPIVKPLPRRVAVRRAPVTRPRTPTAPARHEIAHIVPHALSNQLSAAQIAAQEEQFARTIARARAQNDPVSGAERSEKAAAAQPRYRYNFTGAFGHPNIGEGILTPVKRWRDGPYVYYYVEYWVQYPDGSTETGYVPWPLRYLAADDPFARGLRRMPLPGPLPDYTAPPGTIMHPLVKFCYDHRLQYCTIQHD